ncbi:hypothetical protein E0Z10_g10472 [Xylaria hypoxylon]|uniref:Uncharacterized protein n=1 Tax=Xylaria hypoxylon TaxID=37992 RepID=A0A4Z0YGA8_9PEZI|nr:hypothetical protein E0Z10_g10472 [Xylaria hypoxylon]
MYSRKHGNITAASVSLMFKIKEIEESETELENLMPGNGLSTTRQVAESSFHPETCTSTGGLIAIMLSRFRMSVNEAITQYKDLGGKIFGSPRLMHYRRLPPLFIPRDKFPANNLIKAVNEVCDKHGYAVRAECSFSTVALAINHSGCKTLVTALAAKREVAIQQTKVIFRSYDILNSKKPENTSSWIPGPACGLPVWMIARAITAAPTYFKPINFPDSEGNQWDFKDGGLQANNPAKQGFTEVRHATGKDPDLFVSIGTCHQQKSFFTRKAGRCMDTWNAVMTYLFQGGDPNEVHHDMVDNLGRTEGENYWRFEDSVSAKRGPRWKKIKMDQWKTGTNSTLDTMDELIDEYLKEEPVNERLNSCACALVKQRRLRTVDLKKWSEYAIHDWRYDKS